MLLMLVLGRAGAALASAGFALELEPELEPPLDEVNYAVEVVAEPIHDDWGGLTPFRSTKKTKKGKRAV